MDILSSDLRHALRQLSRARGFTVVAALTLAVGLAANIALFTIIDAVVARPMPGVRNASSLVWITPINAASGRARQLSYPDYLDLARSGVFLRTAAMGSARFSVSGGGDPIRVDGEVVTAGYFSLAGAHMALGREFTAEEDRPGATPVAVISHQLWQSRFGADPAIVGRRIVINGRDFTVVGVAEPRFIGLSLGDTPRSLWVPMAMQPIAMPQHGNMINDRLAGWIAAAGELAPRVSQRAANTAVAQVMTRLAKLRVDDERLSAIVVPVRSGLTPHDRQDVVAIGGLATAATMLILLIACANVAGMLVGRGVGRRREIAVRLSIGASRGRLIKQLLTESIVLSTLASGVGLLLALWAIDVLRSRIDLPLDLQPNLRMVAFAVGAAVLTGILFGLVPALHTSRSTAAALRDGGIGVDHRRSRLHGGFVVAQVALSLILLVMAGMFIVGVNDARRRDIGFDASEHVLAASFDLAMQQYDSSRATTFIDEATRRARVLPGVTNVSAAQYVPLGNRRELSEAEPILAPEQAHDATRSILVYVNRIRPGYFTTIGLPLARGRDFTDADRPGAERVVIVSESFARRAWPGLDAVGQRVRTGDGKGLARVVGVVREAMTYGLGEEPRPTVYWPQRQAPSTRDVTLLVRSSGSAAALGASVRAELARMDKNLPVFDVRTLAGYRASKLADRLLGAALLGTIGAVALILASIGIYAVIAFSVGQRTREIGVRVALGALDAQVVRLFVRQGLRLAGLGVALGVLLAAGAAKVLASAFFGVSAGDALAFAIVPALLAAVALLASWIPARRAARVDPMVALRAE
jgi:predicted permease